MSSKLPPARTPFIGRKREILLLLADLQLGSTVVTVTGPSGIGKTRLARQAARELEGSFPQGQISFCSLATCKSVTDVEGAIADCLGIPQATGERLVQAVSDRGEMLLILDNMDGVAAEVAPLLGQLLDLCPELRILATSIVPVGMDGEVRFELGPLDTSEAISLYMERVNRAWAGQTFSSVDGAAVEELVTRLDRIPLAIELAAARVRVLPPRAMLARFDERFELLRSRTRGRHGSLLEALEITWELLPPREQTILARASVFEGSFTYEAAVAVLDVDATELEMLDLLDGLRSRSLIQLDDMEFPRFSLLESVKEFAGRELQRRGLVAESHLRHGNYYTTVGEGITNELNGPEELEAARWLRNERENLMGVLLRGQEINDELSSRAGLILFSILDVDGLPASSFRLSELTLQAARRTGAPAILAQALVNHATILGIRMQKDEAALALDEALELSRRAGARKTEGWALSGVASMCLVRGEVEEALSLYEDVTRIGREESCPRLEGTAFSHIGRCEYIRKDLGAVERAYKEAISIFKRNGYARHEAHTQINLCGLWSSQGRYDESRQVLLDVLERCRQSAYRVLEGNVLLNLGATELASGRMDDAERHTLKSLEINREIGHRLAAGVSLANLGSIALDRGDIALAKSHFLSGISIIREGGSPRLLYTVLPFLAAAQARSGQLEEAHRNLDEVKSFYQQEDDEWGISVTDLLTGVLELAEARQLAELDPRRTQELVSQARQRLSTYNVPRAERSESLAEAFRLLSKDLERWTAGDGELLSDEAIRIGPEAAWFELAGQDRVDLHRRLPLRRMLEVLARRRLSAPGKGYAPHELFEAGWPDEEIQPDAAASRVYLGIWTLRNRGLSGLLLNQTDGYLFDPSVPLIIEENEEQSGSPRARARASAN